MDRVYEVVCVLQLSQVQDFRGHNLMESHLGHGRAILVGSTMFLRMSFFLDDRGALNSDFEKYGKQEIFTH